jgi:L-alanine-DL-glutamate epimerase-like enolase superfamily enzyme
MKINMTNSAEHTGKNEKSNKPSNRRDFVKKVSVGGMGVGLFLNEKTDAGIIPSVGEAAGASYGDKPSAKVMITDLRCAIIANSPVVRITTNVGISGYGQAETAKNYLKPYVLFYKDYLIGMDPTNVERVMMKIRRLGSFKPWGSAVSAIEMALWDIAGKVAGVPVYKLLGGKIRDHVRVYDGAVRFPPTGGTEPKDYADQVAKIKASAEGFSIIKMGIAFHSRMPAEIPGFFLGDADVSSSPAKVTPTDPKEAVLRSKSAPHPNRGLLTEKGLNHIIACVDAMKKVLGDEVGLALDCGPGFMVTDAIRLAKAMEPYNLMWLEDMLTGDYYPYVEADIYREVTRSTTTPIHTGEQIYLRQNFRELISQKAVRVIGPDPADVGGIAEMKWIAEYADLHGIQIAPHGIFDGLIGLAAQVQAGAAMPENYIAFEYSIGNPKWWYDIVEGLPDPVVKNGLIEVWDRPGLGVDFIVKAARQYLSPEDKTFFD